MAEIRPFIGWTVVRDRGITYCSGFLHFSEVAIPRLTRTAVAAVLLTLPGASVAAQFSNTDGGRPGRIEDATPTPRRAVDFEIGSFQFERMRSGTSRYRFDPGVAWGVLPRTELSLRLPLVQLKPSSATGLGSSSGLAGVGIGAQYQLNIETGSLPSMAVAGEVLVRAGGMASPHNAFVAKLLATKRMGRARFHLNVGGGNYSVVVSPASPSGTQCDTLQFRPFGVPVGSCGEPPIIIDFPCSAYPAGSSASMLGAGAVANRTCMPSAAQEVGVAKADSRRGARWFAGVGVDHALPLMSLLFSADVLAEQFRGLYDQTDGLAELGVRKQMTPAVVLHAGAGWRFAGAVRSVSITFGGSFELAMPLVHRQRRS